MAYLPDEQNDQLDEEQRQAQAGSAPASMGATVGTATSPAPTSSGQFSDLRAYLEANKEQGQDLANRMGQQVADQATTAQSSTESARNAWTRNAQAANNQWGDQNQTAYNQWLQGKRNELTQNDAEARAAIERNASRPGGWGAAGDAATLYGQQRNDILGAQFTPTDAPTYEAYTPDLTAVESAKERLQSMSTQPGREALLAEMYNQPGQNTSGGTRLDAAILGSANPNMGADLTAKYGPLLEALANQESPVAPSIPATEFRTLGQITEAEEAKRQAAEEAKRAEEGRKRGEAYRDRPEREPVAQRGK